MDVQQTFGCKERKWKKEQVLNFNHQIVDTNQDFKMKSGDVLLFNGAWKYQVYHGIESMDCDSSPEFLPQIQHSRISVQFREVEYTVSTRRKLFGCTEEMT